MGCQGRLFEKEVYVFLDNKTTKEAFVSIPETDKKWVMCKSQCREYLLNVYSMNLNW